MNVPIIDEHYYRSADWFLKNAGRYDNYPRNGSKVFVGEYAVHADNSIVGSNRNNWQSALASASLMTGLERNADVVQMASYAPLFANIDAWQWAPDMIWVDNLARTVLPQQEIPLGVITSLVGSVFFLLIMRRQRL